MIQTVPYCFVLKCSFQKWQAYYSRISKTKLVERVVDIERSLDFVMRTQNPYIHIITERAERFHLKRLTTDFDKPVMETGLFFPLYPNASVGWQLKQMRRLQLQEIAYWMGGDLLCRIDGLVLHSERSSLVPRALPHFLEQDTLHPVNLWRSPMHRSMVLSHGFQFCPD